MQTSYGLVADTLRRKIISGEYAPDTTLPKQADLAASFEVNLGTVRRAIALLEAEGLVTPIRRRGTVVRSQPPMRRLGADRYAKSKWKHGDVVAFAADREASGRPWQATDQSNTVRRTEADDDTAAALGIEPGTEVYERARLVRDQRSPTHTLTSYYRVEDVEGTALVDPAVGPAGRGGGFAVLTAQGLEPDRITESVHARMPAPDEIAMLELPAGEPVMILERTVCTADGRPIEFARGVHAASRFHWSYTFTIPD